MYAHTENSCVHSTYTRTCRDLYTFEITYIGVYRASFPSKIEGVDRNTMSTPGRNSQKSDCHWLNELCTMAVQLTFENLGPRLMSTWMQCPPLVEVLRSRLDTQCTAYNGCTADFWEFRVQIRVNLNTILQNKIYSHCTCQFSSKLTFENFHTQR